MIKKILYMFITSILTLSCSQGFLDIKPAKNLVVLSTIEDFEALLDRVAIFNEKGSQSLSLISSDDYFLTKSSWETIVTPFQRNVYIWDKEIFEGTQSADWDNGYERIFYSNIAIEGLNKIVPSENDQKKWNDVMARALFHRAWNHFNILVLFGEYGSESQDLSNKIGIPLRKESDITIPVTRENVKAAYDFIIEDLNNAQTLFDDSKYNIERPSKQSVLALLARVYLYFQDYEKAFHNADLCLKMNAELIDYNELDASRSYPFPAYGLNNKEILFNSWQPSISALAQSRLCIDTNLLVTYSNDDLRLGMFFRDNGLGNKTFKGSYVGNLFMFSGISLNEVYVIGMEAAARIDKLDVALSLYNNLKIKRINKLSYVPQYEVSKDQLIELILKEKRKEMVLRSNRWEDLKRFNNTSGAKMILTRKLDNQIYTLPPFDNRYTMPIPEYVIKFSGVQQNIR